MQGSVFIVHTRSLLMQRPRTTTYEKIAEETGLSTRWLARFAASNDAGEEIDFGAMKVETLYTYLSGKSLQL